MGEIKDTVRKWGLNIDGRRDRMMFLERPQELKSCYGIPEEQLLLVLPAFFRGHGLLRYRNNRVTWRR